MLVIANLQKATAAFGNRRFRHAFNRFSCDCILRGDHAAADFSGCFRSGQQVFLFRAERSAPIVTDKRQRVVLRRKSDRLGTDDDQHIDHIGDRGRLYMGRLQKRLHLFPLFSPPFFLTEIIGFLCPGIQVHITKIMVKSLCIRMHSPHYSENRRK